MADGWIGDERAVRAFRRDPGRPADLDAWPATVPAMAQILRDGLEMPAGLVRHWRLFLSEPDSYPRRLL